MTARECAEILRSAISHRERMNANLYAIDEDGRKTKITPRDYILDAMKFALTAVEEKLQ